MPGLIKVLLIFALIYFLFRILFRYVLPVVFTKFINRKMEEMTNRANGYQSKEQKKREGDVTIKYEPNSKKTYSKDSGDYIDFEEIKE